MKQIKRGDHFFEKSSSMNALIVAKWMQLSNVKLETWQLWNRVVQFSTTIVQSTIFFCLFVQLRCSGKKQYQMKRKEYVGIFSLFNDQQCWLAGRDVSVG